MILMSKNNQILIDSLSYLPMVPETMTETYLTERQIVNHWKINNGLTFEEESTGNIRDINIYNEDGTDKSPQEIYDMLSSWERETLFNAFFNHDFEAGNIKGGGEEIDRIIVKRLSPETNYSIYETIGEIPYSKESTESGFKDYLIASGQVYLYSVQPVTTENHFGALQNKVPGLNRYEYTWIIDSSGAQIKIINCTIEGAITYNSKDGIIETIGSETPFVNRFSNLNYRSFNIKGTIASEFDDYNHIKPKVHVDTYGNRADIKRMIDSKYMQKTGMIPERVSNSMRIDHNFERKFREEITNILNNGREKVFKGPTEGLIKVKLSNVQITPVQGLGRLLYDFSAVATETGRFGTDDLSKFSFPESVINEK